MHGKGEFAKLKGSICNIPIEAVSRFKWIGCGRVKTRS